MDLVAVAEAVAVTAGAAPDASVVAATAPTVVEAVVEAVVDGVTRHLFQPLLFWEPTDVGSPMPYEAFAWLCWTHAAVSRSCAS